MSRQQFKARNRTTQRMTKDGLVQRNESTGDDKNISTRYAELDLHSATVSGDIQNKVKPEAQSTRQGYSQVGNNLESSTRNFRRAASTLEVTFTIHLTIHLTKKGELQK